MPYLLKLSNDNQIILLSIGEYTLIDSLDWEIKYPGSKTSLIFTRCDYQSIWPREQLVETDVKDTVNVNIELLTLKARSK